MTTIHGFCNRLLAAHPVAAGIDPGFRVLDAPEAERAAARGLRRGARASSSPAATASARGDRRGLRRRRPAGDGRSASTPSCAAAAWPSRACPSRPRRDVAGALRAAALAAAAEALAELKPSASTKRELLERALAPLAGAASRRPTSTSSARCGPTSRAEAARRLPRGDRGGDRRASPRPARAATPTATSATLLGALLRRASRRPRSGAPGLDFEDLQILAARLLERSRDRRRPTAPASATCWSTSSRTPTACSCA